MQLLLLARGGQMKVCCEREADFANTILYESTGIRSLACRTVVETYSEDKSNCPEALSIHMPIIDRNVKVHHKALCLKR